MNRFAQLALSEEGFIFDPMSGQSYQVNPTGMFIFKELRADRCVSEIVLLLTDAFDVSAEEASRDVVDFIERLKRYGIVRVGNDE